MINGIIVKAPVDNSTILGVNTVSSPSEGRLLHASYELDKKFTELTAKSGEAIIILLQNKIAFQRPVYDRNKTWLGIIWNTLTRETPGYIEVQGTTLLSILKLLGETADTEITPEATYLLPFTEAKRILRRLSCLDKTKP